MRIQFVLPLLSLLIISAHDACAASCFYINSYHEGYEWSDRIQAQFARDAQDVCRTTYHYLNAKNDSVEKLKNKGVEIANLIALQQPDIVIAADDAASHYVVSPFLKNGRIPVVYVGINWDPKPYGYPMDNATGMTEMWPVEDVLSVVQHATRALQQIAIVTGSGALEQKDAEEIKKICNRNGVGLTAYFVNNFEDWKKAVINAQSADAIYLGTNQAIKNWNEAEAISWLKTHNHRFTFASLGFMNPYVMFSLSKSPEEFGHWAALLTKAILNGDQPWQIPIIPNHQFIPYYNESLLNLTPFKLPSTIQRHALKYMPKQEIAP